MELLGAEERLWGGMLWVMRWGYVWGSSFAKLCLHRKYRLFRIDVRHISKEDIDIFNIDTLSSDFILKIKYSGYLWSECYRKDISQ